MGRRQIIIPLFLVLTMFLGISPARCESYKNCRECHRDIFRLWSGSLHAKSYTNSTFQATYMSVMLDRGKEVARHCLRCHAPMAHLNDDDNPSSPAATEGVNCTFCHSVSSIGEGGIDNYYHLDTSGTVYGPYQPSSPSGHQTQYSPLHLVSDLCAGCHEFTNEHGVGVLETYSEWQASSYAKDEVYCQNCHMPIMPDLTVADNRKVDNYYVTAHEFRGGHSNINLTHAVKLKTVAKLRGDQLNVKTFITNAESGHKLPTGIPVRKLVLSVALKSADGTEISVVRRVYRKVLTDRYGTIIENVPDMFLNATNIYSDNRIKPKETRIEEMTFEIPQGMRDYYVEATLTYEYSRPILTEEFISVEMAKKIIHSQSIPR